MPGVDRADAREVNGATGALDLNNAFPRSPKNRLGPYAHLARMVDKARAKAAGTLGAYIYPCPLDRVLLDFLTISDEALLAVAKDRTDEDVLRWIYEHAKARCPQEIRNGTKRFWIGRPKMTTAGAASWRYETASPPHRSDVTTWVDLLDLEEGR